MSNKKAKKSDVNKERLKALKKIGILSDTSLRGTLKDADKKKIRKEWKKFHVVANAPPGEYISKTTKNLSEYDRKALKQSGYLLTDKKIYLPTQGYETATIKSKWGKTPTGGPEKQLIIERQAGGGRKVEQEFIGKNLQKMSWRDRLLHEYQSGNFKEGDYIAVKVFDNGVFEREIVQNINVLFRYLENIHWKLSKKVDEQYMYDNLHIVKISVKNYRDLSITDSELNKSRKFKDHQKYVKKKNRVKTKTRELVGKVTRK